MKEELIEEQLKMGKKIKHAQIEKLLDHLSKKLARRREKLKN